MPIAHDGGATGRSAAFDVMKPSRLPLTGESQAGAMTSDFADRVFVV